MIGLTVVIDGPAWAWLVAVFGLVFLAAFVCGMAYGIMRDAEARAKRDHPAGYGRDRHEPEPRG